MASRVVLTINKAALISVEKDLARKTGMVAKALETMTKDSMGTSGFPQIRTGRLKDSIKSSKINKYLYKVFTDVFYGIYLEFGTSKMAPLPFFRPNINRLKRQVKGIIEG